MPLKKRGSKKVTRKRRVGRPRGTATGTPEVMENILSVARKHFAGRGFKGTNLKDIALEAKVANSLLTYHFKGKERLFEEAVITVARARTQEIAELIPSDPHTRQELDQALTIIVEGLLTTSIKHHEVFNTLQREMRDGNTSVVDVFEATYLKCTYDVIDFLTRAQDRKLVRADADLTSVAILLFSATCDSVENDHLVQRYLGKTLTDPTWRKQMARQIVNLFMGGIAQ